MKTILVPTDFSVNSDNACKYAVQIAKEFGAKIILMHTFETPILYSDIGMMTAQLDYSMVYNSALKDLQNYHKKLAKAAEGVNIELVLQQGLASARIKEIALEKKADLIVMGTTGRGAVERIILGSNASRVIRNAPCLVLAIPAKVKYSGFKKIVYTTDLLNDNLNHTKTLIPFAKKFNSEILILNINTHYLTGNANDDLKKVTQKIKDHVKYAKTSGYICDDVSIVNGINFFLKKQKADCLAMYTHHRSMFENIFQPSITREVAVHAKVPLLVIHEKDFIEGMNDEGPKKEKKGK